MRTKEISNGYVTIEIAAAECLALAEACGEAAIRRDTAEQFQAFTVFEQLEGHLETLALVASAANHAANASELLTTWTMASVRQGYDILG